MTIGNFVDYILKKYPGGTLPINSNTYQTWWGLLAVLNNGNLLVGRSFVHEYKNEHNEVEYHRIDPLSVAITENKEDGTKTVHQWQGPAENVFQIGPYQGE